MVKYETNTNFWLESLKGNDLSDLPRHKCEDNIKADLGKIGFGLYI
jgi:hypothetical protein